MRMHDSSHDCLSVGAGVFYPWVCTRIVAPYVYECPRILSMFT